MMSHPSLVDFVISVLQREDIAKLCTEDFFNNIELNPNKEQADGDSTESEDDQSGIDTKNKTEQLRLDLIKIIAEAYKIDRYQEGPEDFDKCRNKLAPVSKKVITFVTQELCQFEWKTLNDCIQILAQVAGVMPEDICSFILEQNAVL